MIAAANIETAIKDGNTPRQRNNTANMMGRTNIMIGGYMIRDTARLKKNINLLLIKNPIMQTSKNMRDKLYGMRYHIPAKLPAFVINGMLMADTLEAKELTPESRRIK
jgi:hypothetical protein